MRVNDTYRVEHTFLFYGCLKMNTLLFGSGRTLQKRNKSDQLSWEANGSHHATEQSLIEILSIWLLKMYVYDKVISDF